MVFDGPGTPLALREFALPRLGAGELLVRVECSTLCGSDVHTFEGRRSTPCPTILGHEILGRVAALPSDESLCDHTGRELEIGDRVTWSVAASCGGCFYCRRGLPQKCERLFKYGHEQLTEAHAFSGGLSEYCHLARGTTVLCVPDALPDAVACPANCATATVAAAMRYGGDCADAVVLVQGAGMLGLTAAAMAADGGAREVIVCDLDGARLERAKRFGATRAVTAGQAELREVTDALTEGRGVDLALDMCGAPDAIEMGVELLRTGGQYVWVGAVFPARPLALSAETVVRKLLFIRGVHNYAPQDLLTALTFLERTHSRYPFADLVTETFPLEQANEAFARAAEGTALRVAVKP